MPSSSLGHVDFPARQVTLLSHLPDGQRLGQVMSMKSYLSNEEMISNYVEENHSDRNCQVTVGQLSADKSPTDY